MTIRTINNLSYTFAKKIDIRETRRFDKKTRFYSKQIRSETQAKVKDALNKYKHYENIVVY